MEYLKILDLKNAEEQNPEGQKETNSKTMD